MFWGGLGWGSKTYATSQRSWLSVMALKLHKGSDCFNPPLPTEWWEEFKPSLMSKPLTSHLSRPGGLKISHYLAEKQLCFLPIVYHEIGHISRCSLRKRGIKGTVGEVEGQEERLCLLR